MKKKTTDKLALHRDTLRWLDTDKLQKAVGGETISFSTHETHANCSDTASD